VDVLPSLKLIKQPIFPPAVFQKEIFAVKNPRGRVLTYSDLCTVYPYQRKLNACVFKKEAIPELHHPDIQLVPEPDQSQKKLQPVPAPSSVTGMGKLDPRTKLSVNLQRNALAKGAGNIQDILEDEDRDLGSNSDEDRSQETRRNDESSVAESSNKKEELVIKSSARRQKTSRKPASSSVKKAPPKKAVASPPPRLRGEEITTRKPRDSNKRPRSSSRKRSGRKGKRIKQKMSRQMLRSSQKENFS